MSTSRLFTLIGASIFRRYHHHCTTTVSLLLPTPQIPYVKLFPSPPTPLRFHHRYCSLAAVLESTTTLTTTVTADGKDTSSKKSNSHPWSEWVAFVDKLKTKGYIAESSVNEAEAAADYAAAATVGVYSDMHLLKDPCLNFARDRFDIFKSLSREEIRAVVDQGCPKLSRKAVNSAKRLRAYLQLDEGNVCGACALRGSCDRAYVILKDNEADARTVDIVRILLLHALDPLVTSGGVKSPKREVIEVSARKLLSELVELSETDRDPDLPEPAVNVSQPKKNSIGFGSNKDPRDVEMKRGDWMCPECNFLNFAKNVRCLECREDGPKRVVHGADVEMKEGDWVCPECNFMNFARNRQCRQCRAQGPQRPPRKEVEMKKGDWHCAQCGFMNFASNIKCKRCQDSRPNKIPGEWKCLSCGFFNFSRNVVCKKCNSESSKKLTTEEKLTTEYDDQIWKRQF